MTAGLGVLVTMNTYTILLGASSLALVVRAIPGLTPEILTLPASLMVSFLNPDPRPQNSESYTLNPCMQISV